MSEPRTIAIIGAGPVGLAAAAHAIERGMKPLVFEAGPRIGHAVRQWAHVPMFSPWAFNIDPAAARLLQETGWTSPDPALHPTGGELVADYLQPLAERTQLRDSIRLGCTITSVSRQGYDKVKSAGRDAAPFLLRYRDAGGGGSVQADAVIDASGTWFSPNPGGSGGIPAIGELEASSRIASGMPDVTGPARARYAGKRVAVLGGGHSAVGTLIALAALKQAVPETGIVWLYRGARLARAFGGGAADQLSARGELGIRIEALVRDKAIAVETRFRLEEIVQEPGGLSLLSDDGRTVAADELVVATGFRPELGLLRELRVSLDPALECPPVLAPLIDPNLHSCGTVRPHGAVELAHPEPGFYIAGMKSYGRAPTFLLATGHEQVRSIVAAIAGDHAAARRVELVLPETGVCSLTPGGTRAAEPSCGGGPAPVENSACCAQDAGEAPLRNAGCSGAPKASRQTREPA